MYSGNEFTWSLWVYLNDIATNQLFIKHGTAFGAAGDGAYLNYFSNRVMFTSPLNGAEVQSPLNAIPQNTWTHLSVVVNLNQLHFMLHRRNRNCIQRNFDCYFLTIIKYVFW